LARLTIWQEIRDWLRSTRRRSAGAYEGDANEASLEAVYADPTPVERGLERRSRTSAMRGLERRGDSAYVGAAGELAAGIEADRGRAVRSVSAEAVPSNVIPLNGRSSATEGVLDLVSEERELLDFLAADVDPVPADPAFRERLREELWETVIEEGVGARSDGIDLVRSSAPERARDRDPDR